MQANGNDTFTIKPMTFEHLAPDKAAWIPVAEKVLAGEYDNADRSTCDSIIFGLQGVPKPICEDAIEKLVGQQKKR